MFSNKITTIIVSLLLGLLVFSAATNAAATTTYSGVTTTYSGVTTTYSGITTTYSGVTTTYSGPDKVENVTNTVKPTIPVATVTEKASQTSTSTPSKNTAGFEVILAIMTLSVLWFKLKRK
ncbi:MAG: hypothetical protein Q7J35_09995 [Candidatus Methanoperedens sp.]|nr:hypothetical protein [Candidatus Methanoperedens sp.]